MVSKWSQNRPKLIKKGRETIQEHENTSIGRFLEYWHDATNEEEEESNEDESAALERLSSHPSTINRECGQKIPWQSNRDVQPRVPRDLDCSQARVHLCGDFLAEQAVAVHDNIPKKPQSLVKAKQKKL